MADITLTLGMRNNLISLQDTSNLINRTQTRMSTGKKVNTALDNPTNFFAAQNHMARVDDLNTRKDGMSEAVQLVKAADAGITGVSALIAAAKGVAQAALATTSATDRANYALTFNTLLVQIRELASDSGYRGTNLLNNAQQTVEFGQVTSGATLNIIGFDSTAYGLCIGSAATTAAVAGIATQTGATDINGVSTGASTALNWVTSATGANAAADKLNIQTSSTQLETALNTLRSKSAALSANLNVVTTRQDFTKNMINTLTTGSDNLTLADMNEEGANMLMLQTRQSLGITSLSLASQAAQAVLRLF